MPRPACWLPATSTAEGKVIRLLRILLAAFNLLAGIGVAIYSVFYAYLWANNYWIFAVFVAVFALVPLANAWAILTPVKRS
jgi:uncharacterized membrane protein YcjF (UPF0283 family)